MPDTKEEDVLKERSAGILMHITSLPGPAYIGDVGPAATTFAEFLGRAKQSVWQMLPVQPSGKAQSFSPYSAVSAMAGNPLLISPELLVRDGWLDARELKKNAGSHARVDYDKAQRYKDVLLNKAWQKWKESAGEADRIAFTEFRAKEAYWLDDYALYSSIKSLHKEAPWYEWPEPYRVRHQATLSKFAHDHADELQKIMWVQMIFDRQWTSLHKLCDALQIRLFGDVPIYVSHDSADVWSHPELFTLDEKGQLTEVAGVPPDLFNDEGQLWGMPLFRWDVARQQDFSWWVQRLRKNMQWFDMIRLDHFRGFASYWCVPANARSAKEGQWVQGPGAAFFETLQKELGGLPFVAEDLGEIDQAVYQLRDAFRLPGMNVLQFAFGDDLPKSIHLPHHFRNHSVVYTGTHDNNTTVGWYKHATPQERSNVSHYTGIKMKNNQVAGHLARLAYMSVSQLAILPMQDVLSLDESARMNMPASTGGNWTWRCAKNLLTTDVEEWLAEMCFLYDREPAT